MTLYVQDEYRKDLETSNLSDADTSDDGGASDDNASTSQLMNASTPATFSESIPNSPLSHWYVAGHVYSYNNNASTPATFSASIPNSPLSHWYVAGHVYLCGYNINASTSQLIPLHRPHSPNPSQTVPCLIGTMTQIPVIPLFLRRKGIQ